MELILNPFLLGGLAFVAILFVTGLWLASRYVTCPSDQILVVYGKVKGNQSAQCIHGGGTFILPLIQDYKMLSLQPLTLNIDLQNALSKQNIRVNVPSNFLIGVSTDPHIMTNAAERLLNLDRRAIENLAKEVILGQMRLTIASLDIEEINQDREKFLTAIRTNVEPELNKIGLYLINVNVTDITDESGYIAALGQKAAAEAVNQAKVDVAEQEKSGEIGQAVATKEREVQVVANIAEAEKGKKQAEAGQRVYVQQQEAEAVKGEAEAAKEMYQAKAELEVKKAETQKLGEVARLRAEQEIQKEQYLAEQERLKAEEILRQEVEKAKITIDADAEAEKLRRIAQGQADATKAQYEAEAEGIKKVMQAKADGIKALVEGCGGDANAAVQVLMIEKFEKVAETQAKAISNIKFDKVVVWDGSSGSGNGSATGNFLSGMVKALPPLHEVANMAGIDLPKVLGDQLPEEVSKKPMIKRGKQEEKQPQEE